MAAPYPDLGEVNDTLTIVNYANTVTDGYLVPLITMAAAAILIITITTYYKEVRLSTAFFYSFMMTSILSSFLWASGLLASPVITIYIIFTIGTALWSYTEN